MATGSAWAQVDDSPASELEIKFLKSSVEIDENSFRFNSLSIANFSSLPKTVIIQTHVPAFLNLISSLPDEPVVIEAGETYYVPFRFNVVLDQQFSSVGKFKVTIVLAETEEKIEKDFDIVIKSFYKSRTGLQQPELVLRNHAQRYKLGYFIENLGNVTDEYEVSIETHSNIIPVKRLEKVTVKPGELRIEELEVMIRPLNMELESTLHIYIKSNSGEKKLLVQKFRRIETVFNQGIYSRTRFPLSVELQAQNLATGQAFYSAGLHGSIDLPRDKKLSVYMVSDSYYKGYRTRSGIVSISYQTKKNRIILGNTQDFRQFFIAGNGIELQHTDAGRGLYRFSAIKSRLENASLYSFTTEQLLAKKLSFTSENFVHIDKGRETNSYLTIGSVKWLLDRYTSLTLSAGGGYESINKSKYNFDTSLRGSTAGYEFESKRENLGIKSKVTLYSKSIPGFNKGFTYHMHEIKKPFQSGFLSAFYEVNKKIFNQTYDSLIRLSFNVANKETGIRTSVMADKFSVSTTVSRYSQQQDSANSAVANMARVAVNLNWMIAPSVTFSLFSNAGRISIPHWPHIKPYFAFTNFGGIQVKRYGVQLRWDFRPFSYFEIKQFAHVPDSFRLFQLVPYVEHTFKKINLSYRFNVNYTNDKSLGYKFSVFGNDLTYLLPDKGIELALHTQFNVQERKNSYINLKLRKSLTAPGYRARESYNFDMILFKDLNGNDIYDETDELIPGAQVLVNNILLNSNPAGVIQFRNMGDRSYQVDFSKIRNLRGWMAKAGHVQKILLMANEKKIYIPFRESRGIRGNVKLIADEKSNRRMSLSNIRVTATDQNGQVFHTLTDVNNEFYFDLPAGNYMIMINQGVFDEEFRPAEVSKLADLVNNTTFFVQFEVRQRKRVINIKHEDDEEE